MEASQQVVHLERRPLNRALTRTTQRQGFETAALISDSAIKAFFDLPNEAHNRLRNACAQLNAQNAVGHRLKLGIPLPPNPSAVEQYEAARYHIDYPFGNFEMKAQPQIAWVHKTAEQDYLEYLCTRRRSWQISLTKLQRREATRVKLLRIAIDAVDHRLIEMGNTTSFTLELHCFGSLRAGYAMPWSEVDLALVTKNVPTIIHAELPDILKIAFRAAGYSIESEVTSSILKVREEGLNSRPHFFNIHFSHFELKIRTTLLFQCYRGCDDRVYEMGIFLKNWAHTRRIDDPRNGTLPSFCYIVMLLHFLMHIATPPVVPNLQLTNIGTQSSKLVKGHETSFWDRLDEIIQAARDRKLTNNHQSSAELLRGFFHYFSVRNFSSYGGDKFIWKDQVVTICQAHSVTKKSKNWDRFTVMNGARIFNFCAIEDPFNPHNNLAGGLGWNELLLIKDEFIRANKIVSRACFVPNSGWKWTNCDGMAEDLFTGRAGPKCDETA